MKRIGLIAALLWLFSPLQPCLAHWLWLNLSDDRPAVGTPVDIEIGWGHHFPDGEPLKEGYLNQIRALDPSGNEIGVVCHSPKKCTFTPSREGRYRILADIHPGFVTKTTQGYQMKPKTGLDGALTCFRHDIRTKTEMRVGGPESGPGEPVGDLLEIVPMTDPQGLHAGDGLVVQVIHDGKPVSGARIQATYEGFSDKPNTFAVEESTDEQGRATVRVETPGKWLVAVTHALPYADAGVCDEYRYKYSLTFSVKP